MRSRFLVRRKLLNRPVSSAAVALQAALAALLSSDCHLCGAPFGKIFPLPTGAGCRDAVPGIAGETRIRPQRAENIRGGLELAHPNQVAASPLPVFGEAGAREVSGRTVARKRKEHAIRFEAEPEEEFAVQAQ